MTSQAAIDTELGILKTGKEADVFLLERAVPDDPTQASVLAAKRYRSEEHRSFHRSAAYTEGRRTRSSRDARALAKKTAHGRARRRRPVGLGRVGGAQALLVGRRAGPLPGADRRHRDPDGVRPRSTARRRRGWRRPGRSATCCGRYFDQLREAMAVLARHGVAHGDLSPYNILAAGERLVIIDLPQVVDIVAQPQRDGLPDARLPQRLHLVRRPRARRRSPTSTRCSATCWLTPSDRGAPVRLRPGDDAAGARRRSRSRASSSSTRSWRGRRRRCGTGASRTSTCANAPTCSAASTPAARCCSAASSTPTPRTGSGSAARWSSRACPTSRSTPTARRSTPRRSCTPAWIGLRRHPGRPGLRVVAQPPDDLAADLARALHDHAVDDALTSSPPAAGWSA